MVPSDTRPLGGQENPAVPAEPVPQEQQDETKLIKLWDDRFKKSKAFLEPYFERDQQAFEFWYMWREFRGPYRSNIFPPDVHAGIESVVPRLTKGRPRPIVKPRPNTDAELLIRVQHGHDAFWDRMGMDAKFETITKRGTWFGFGPEKVTPKVDGHEEPVTEEVEVLDPQTGEPTGETQQRQALNDDGTPKTRFVVDYAGPVSEVCDPARVFFPRGYATDDELPWVLFQYFKRKSELDTSIYPEEKLEGLEQAPNQSEDPTLERDKVHRLPRKSQVLGQPDEDNLGQATNDLTIEDDKEDPTIELWEIWTRPTKKHPKGQLISIGNRKKVLRSRDSTMPEGELPINSFRYIEDTFNYRGMGLARQLERLVLERADKRNQRMDNVTRVIDRMWKVQEDEPLEDGDLEHRPSGVVRVRDMNNLQEIGQSDVTQNAYQEDSLILQDEARATGANEYVVGGGKTTANTLGEADKMSSSSNERYDGVIRRLERFLNRHAKLVHLIVQQTVVDNQHMDWTDGEGQAQSADIDPADFMAVKADQVVYDAKSVIAYKEVSRQQGMQLLELVSKLLDGDPTKLPVLKPILIPLLELFDEIKVSAGDLIQGLEAYAKAKQNVPPPPPPLPSPDKVLSSVASILKVDASLVTFDQVQQALEMNGIKPVAAAPQLPPGAPPEGPEMPPGTPEVPGASPEPTGDVVPLNSPVPDESQILAAPSRIPNHSRL